MPSTLRQVDAVIVGAGFAGLYALYRLRGLGLTAQVFEAGAGRVKVDIRPASVPWDASSRPDANPPDFVSRQTQIDRFHRRVPSGAWGRQFDLAQSLEQGSD